MKYRAALQAVLTALFLLLVGCTTSSPSETRNGPQTCLMAFFDLSVSTGSNKSPPQESEKQEIRGRYFTEFQRALEECRGGEAVVGEAITDNPLAEGTLPIDDVLPRFNPLTINRDDFEASLREAIQHIESKVRLLLNRQPTKHTDIFTSLLLAEKVLNGERFGKAPNKVLILFSDMRQDSPAYNFDRITLTERRAQQILDELKAKGQLPNLSGVKVWVAGAGVSQDAPASVDKLLEIQKFWMKYFEACGAQLTAERYGPTLMNFGLDEK